MSRLRRNFLSGTLLASITDVATSITSTAFASLPVVTAPDVMDVTLDQLGVGGVSEIVTITAHASTSTAITASRGQRGTTARSHAANIGWVHAAFAAEDFPRVEYVTNYGALCDGTTDDSVAVQATITALGAAGGDVLFPPGTCVAKALTLPSKVRLVGAGYGATTLKLAASANTFLVETTSFTTLAAGGGGAGAGTSTAGASQFAILDMGIDGNKANNSSTVPLIRTYGYDFNLARLRVRDSDDVGLYCEWSSSDADPGPDAMETTVVDVKVHGSDGDGIQWRGPHDSKWLAVVAYSNGGKGIYVAANGGALTAVGCHSWGTSQTYAWDIQAQVKGSRCTAEGASVAQVRIAASDVYWDGDIFAAGGATTGIEFGIAAVSAPIGCIVRGAVLNCTTAAINYANDGGGNVIDLTVYRATGTTTTTGSRNATGTAEFIRGSGSATSTFLIPSGGVNITGGIALAAADSLVFGGDTAWYRNGANQMRTDDDVLIGTGKGVAVAESGGAAHCGIATLSGGTVVVNTTAVTGNSRIFLTCQVPGGTPGFLSVSARSSGASFTILSSSGTDTSQVGWFIVEGF